MDIEISTHQLCDAVHRSLKASVAMEDVMKVWHCIGLIVAEHLAEAKGIRIDKFGSFSIDNLGKPCFNISSDFARAYRVKHIPTPTVDRMTMSKLNLTQLTRLSGVDRAVADKIQNKFIEHFGAAVQSGKNVLLTLHKVCELFGSRDTVKCTFISDFSKQSRGGSMASPKPRAASAPRARRAIDLDTAVPSNKAASRLAATAASRKVPQKTSGKRLMHTAAPAGNPITGEGMRGGTPRGPARARQRDPILEGSRSGISTPASTGDCMYGFDIRGDQCGRPSSARSYSSGRTPRSRDNGQAPVRRPTSASGLRADRLRQHEQATKAPSKATDARAIAAAALGHENIVDRLRKKIIERGGAAGIHSLGRLLKIMDDNGDKRLTRDEIFYGLRDYGIHMTKTESEQLFQYFDRDRNGFVDLDEFLIGIKGDLSDKRKALVRMAFDILDKDGSGVVTVDELTSAYDVSANPDVQAGKISPQEAMKQFMKQWDRLDGDGMVSIEEFEDYYKGVSASIDRDDYFELMIRNAWRIPGGVGMAANTANKRVLVTNKDGSQRVVSIDNELGMKPGDVDAARARLRQQGVDASAVEMHGGLDTTEKARKAPLRANKAVVSRPREAWGPSGGDMSLPPDTPSRQGAVSNSRSAPPAATVDPVEVLRLTLYDPPASHEQLANKLQASSITSNPRLTKQAVLSRLMHLNPSINKQMAAAIWRVIDPSNVGSVELEALHSLLASKFGKDKSSQKSSSVVDRAIAKIIERTGGGLKGHCRSWMITETRECQKRNLGFRLFFAFGYNTYRTGLRDYGIELNIREIDDIFAVFDRDHNGFIDIDEFLIGIKGDLSDRRKALVRMAFDILDKDGSGFVTIDELEAAYDVSSNPAVRAGKITPREAMKEFMAQWDRLDGDGMVSIEEFEDYYKGISSSIDGDDYFELMIRNAWRIPGGVGMAANTANKRVLVTNKDGSQRVVSIDNELGMKPGDVDAARARLRLQGVDASAVEMHGGLDTTEKARKNRPAQAPRSKKDAWGSLLPQKTTATHEPVYVRHQAAEKLAAAFRGHKGRKEADHVRRKVEAQQRVLREQEEEMHRPKPAQILRPKGKSYIGF